MTLPTGRWFLFEPFITVPVNETRHLTQRDYIRVPQIHNLVLADIIDDFKNLSYPTFDNIFMKNTYDDFLEGFEYYVFQNRLYNVYSIMNEFDYIESIIDLALMQPQVII